MITFLIALITFFIGIGFAVFRMNNDRTELVKKVELLEKAGLTKEEIIQVLNKEF